MNLHKCLLVKNNCYKVHEKMVPKGVMWHSTGANNPALKRYVQPDDGLLGTNTNNNHWNQPTPDGRQVCVHAFIGKLQDGSIATYQTLPFDIKGWHCGSGTKGSGNNGYISFEICEDGLVDNAYFTKIYTEAVEFTAYLCNQYNIDPFGVNTIIDHSTGNKLGIASNHSDVMHWLPRHGKSMATVRQDVYDLLNKSVDKEEEQEVRFNYVKDMPEWAQAVVNKLMNEKKIAQKDGELDLSYDMIRILSILSRESQ